MNRALCNWTLALTLLTAVASAPAEKSRLAGIYVKDGNQNGQLRFLASGLTSSSSSSGSSSLNAALNEYITNKQDMLEQLRPTTSNSGTGLSSVTGTSASDNAIYVNLAAGTVSTGAATGTDSVTSSTGTSGTGTGTTNSNTQAAVNQVIYGSSPINSLLPQIIGEAVSQRRRPANNNRRGVVQRRRRVNNKNKKNNNNTRRRRKNNKAKNGKKRPQVMVVRPNRG